LPKSSDTTSIKEPVATEAAALAKAQGDVKLSEEKGSAAAASEEEVVPNGAC
jgi:hypothetical protein